MDDTKTINKVEEIEEEENKKSHFIKSYEEEEEETTDRPTDRLTDEPVVTEISLYILKKKKKEEEKEEEEEKEDENDHFYYNPSIIMAAIILNCKSWVTLQQISFIEPPNDYYNFSSNHLLLTTIAAVVFAFFAYFIPVFRDVIFIDNITSIVICMFLSICLPFALYIQRCNFPINLFLLLIFTVADAMIIGIAFRLYDEGFVVTALFLSIMTTSRIMDYIFRTKRDLDKTIAGLLIVLVVLFGLAIMNIGGSILSHCLFIVFQTQMWMMKLALYYYIMAILDLFSNILDLLWQLRGLLLLVWYGKRECDSCIFKCKGCCGDDDDACYCYR